jgi:DNA-binding protein YbaB
MRFPLTHLSGSHLTTPNLPSATPQLAYTDATQGNSTMDLDSLMRGLGPIQDTMKKAEQERAQARFEGKASGGAVVIRMTGDLKVTGVTIAPAAAAAATGDPGMLEDLVLVAVNDALKQYVTRFGSSPDDQISKLMGGSDLSSIMGPLMRGLGR